MLPYGITKPDELTVKGCKWLIAFKDENSIDRSSIEKLYLFGLKSLF